ncbi:hypothetical protein KZ483_07955 [Paenibacillus sp. sptzw28]|nr:hypothetical protein KZ483_07955 [Paenibacillus sp. sptzw28]
MERNEGDLDVYRDRRLEIIEKAAAKACAQPILDSGLWFHQDIRDNFYYASYLYAAAADAAVPLSIDRALAKETALKVLAEVLTLQDRDPQSATYGHWPLNLGLSPREARPHVLPVELMGSLMVYFYRTYYLSLPEWVRAAFRAAFEHIYRSPFYKVPLEHYGHHEAKYTAAKLIFGQLYKDRALTDDGRRSLRLTLERIRQHGMSEYGSLPWFWHWVQAFTCAWELADDSEIKSELGSMLDYLWNERARYYLKGAWAGARARSLPHDLPRDRNVLFDYVQFGDFSLPDAMPRTEYAGFLFYEAPAAARDTALNRAEPVEVARSCAKTIGSVERKLHQYVYITERFASGGMWERVKEFDNEQHRWDVTFPLADSESVNHLYFFRPGEGWAEGDPRHESEGSEVLFHRNTILSLFLNEEKEGASYGDIIGVLPKGSWLKTETALFGEVGGTYIAVFMMKKFLLEEKADHMLVTSEGTVNGVVVETIDRRDAGRLGLATLEQLARAFNSRMPQWNEDGSPAIVEYLTLNDDNLRLSIMEPGLPKAFINGKAVDFTKYGVR